MPLQSLPLNADPRLLSLLYGTNPYDMQPLPAGLTANGLPSLPPAPPGAAGSAAPPAGSAAGGPPPAAPSGGAAAGGPGPGGGSLLAPPVSLGGPPGAAGGPSGGGPDFSSAGLMAMAGLAPPPGGPPPAPGFAPGSPSSVPPGAAPPLAGPGAVRPSLSGPAGGGAPGPGALAAAMGAPGPPAGTLAGGMPPDALLRAAPAPMGQADFLAQQGNAPVPGPPVFKPASRGEKIARDILLGVMTAVNPVAGVSMIGQTLARPRLEQEALADYQAQLPAVQQAANRQAYTEYLNSLKTQADLEKGQADIWRQNWEANRATQQESKLQAAAKGSILLDIQNEAAKGLTPPDALEEKWAQYALANPFSGLTRAEIHDAITKTPVTAPAIRQNELDLASAKAIAEAKARQSVEFSPEAINAAVAKAGGEELARQRVQMQAAQNAPPLSPTAKATAQAILDGRMSPPGSFALKTPYWQSVMGEVFTQDPDWSEQRGQLRKDYTVGKHSSEINAINTALSHIGTLNDALNALNNGSVPALNGIANRLGVAVGKDNVTTFNTIVNRVGPELAKAYVGAGGSAGERGTTEKDFSSSMSPQQLRSNIGITADLLRSKISSLENQWNQNAPPGQDFQTRFIMPGAKQALDRIAGGGGAGNIPAGATGTARGSDGKLHYTDGKRDLGVVPGG